MHLNVHACRTARRLPAWPRARQRLLRGYEQFALTCNHGMHQHAQTLQAWPEWGDRVLSRYCVAALLRRGNARRSHEPLQEVNVLQPARQARP